MSVSVTAPTSRRSTLWTIGRVLLVLSAVAMGVAIYFAFRPVENPGVQACGSPALYAIHNTNDERIPGPGSVNEPADAVQLRSQARCRLRVDEALSQGAVALAVGVGLGFLGAVLGLIDDRLAYARAPRFESLLRERPSDAPGDAWDGPVIPEGDLGERLPDLEWEETRVVVGVGVAALVGLAWITPWSAVREALATPSAGWLAVAVVLLALTYPIASAETLGFTDGWRAGWGTFGVVLTAAVASSFTGRLLPEYGPDGLTVHQLVRSGVPRGESVGRIAVLDVLAVGAHGLLLVVFGLAALLVRPTWGTALAHNWLAWLAVATLTVGGLVTGPRRYRNRVIRPDRDALSALASADPLLMLPSAIAAVVLALVNGGVVLALVYGVGGSGSWAAIMVASLAAGIAVVVAPTPDGVGLVEPVLALGLIASGVDAGPAVAAVLIWRLVAFWAPMVPGWLAYRRLHREGVI
ncbi:MAG TPA: YbhN family protein [Acidimicrobiales bacterium]